MSKWVNSFHHFSYIIISNIIKVKMKFEQQKFEQQK